MNICLSLIRKYIVLCFITSLLAGCASTTTVVPEKTVIFPTTDKINLNVKVEIKKSILEASYKYLDYEKFSYQLGDNFVKNIESLSRNIFNKYTISNDQESGVANARFDAILIPELVAIEGKTGMWASNDAQTAIILEWTLKNSKGDVLWVDTVKGVAESGAGTGIGPNNFAVMSNIRIEAAIKDVFLKSYDSIYSSPAIKKLSSIKSK